MHTSGEGLYQSCIKIGEISNFRFFPISFFFFFFLLFFFFFFVNTGPYGRKNFKRHFVRKYTTELLPKIQACSSEVSLPKLYKELWNFKFRIFGIFFIHLFIVCSFGGRLTWVSMVNFKKGVIPWKPRVIDSRETDQYLGLWGKCLVYTG